MTPDVSDTARQLAGQLADAFAQDQALAEQQTVCQDRLRAGNDRLWSGLHPDALGLIYDDAAAGGGESLIAESVVDAVAAGLPGAEVQAAVLAGLQQAHWAIHHAFCDYQQASEDRRHLAAEIGELTAGMVAELVAAGWSDEQARTADVRHLAVQTSVR